MILIMQDPVPELELIVNSGHALLHPRAGASMLVVPLEQKEVDVKEDVREGEREGER